MGEESGDSSGITCGGLSEDECAGVGGGAGRVGRFRPLSHTVGRSSGRAEMNPAVENREDDGVFAVFAWCVRRESHLSCIPVVAICVLPLHITSIKH